ncbi:MAG: hypothetical protein ACI4NE_06175 [Succinivibrio sp.]
MARPRKENPKDVVKQHKYYITDEANEELVRFAALHGLTASQLINRFAYSLLEKGNSSAYEKLIGLPILSEEEQACMLKSLYDKKTKRSLGVKIIQIRKKHNAQNKTNEPSK